MARRYRSDKKFKRRRFMMGTVATLLVLALLGATVWWLFLRSDDSEPGGGAVNTQTSSGSSQNPDEKIDLPTIDKNEWSLRLVNRQNPLPEDFSPDLSQAYVADHYFDSRAVDNLNQMLKDAEAAGSQFWIVSSYRTVQRSRELYEKKIKEYEDQGYSYQEASDKAAMWVAPPGTSEHSLGLAVDLVPRAYINGKVGLEPEIGEEPEYVWLMAHCAEYGFILRYPEDKVNVTGINYEPWHFRYVGVEHAKYIMQNNLCLEEYLSIETYEVP